LQRNLVEVI